MRARGPSVAWSTESRSMEGTDKHLLPGRLGRLNPFAAILIYSNPAGCRSQTRLFSFKTEPLRHSPE